MRELYIRDTRSFGRDVETMYFPLQTTERRKRRWYALHDSVVKNEVPQCIFLRNQHSCAIPSNPRCMLGRSSSINYLSCAPGKQVPKIPTKDKARDSPARASHRKTVGGMLHYGALPPVSLFAPVNRLSLAGQHTQSLRRVRMRHRIIGRATRTLLHQPDRLDYCALAMPTLREGYVNPGCRCTVPSFIIIPSQGPITTGLYSAFEHQVNCPSDILGAGHFLLRHGGIPLPAFGR